MLKSPSDSGSSIRRPSARVGTSRRAQWRNMWRTVRGSLPRFFSLVVIVMLGTAFFSGIRAASPDMVRTADRYMDAYRLADFTMISTVGLTEADVRAVRAQPEVISASGQYWADAILRQGEETAVVRVHAVPDPAASNRPAVLSGRLPEQPDELAVEAAMAAYLGAAIGDPVVFERQTGWTAHTARTRFRISGIVQSPVYIAAEHGQTSAGSGTVQYFAYVAPLIFSGEAYSEIAVRLEGTESIFSFEPAYQALTDAARPRLDALLKARARQRYGELRAEAAAEWLEAAHRLTTAEIEAAEALSAARRELDAGWETYRNGLDAWSAGRRQLENGRRTGETQLADAESALAKARAQYEAGRSAFDLKTAGADGQLAENRRLLDEAGRRLERAESDLTAQAEAVAAQRSDFDALKSRYEQALPERAETADQASERVPASDPLPASERVPVSDGATPAAGVTVDPVRAVESVPTVEAEPVPASAAAGSTVSSQPTADATPDPAPVPPQQAEWEQLKQAYARALERLPALEAAEAELEAARTRLSDERSRYERGLAALAERRAELERGRSELAAAAARLEAGARELADRRADFAEQMRMAEAELSRSAAALEAGHRELTAGEARLTDERADAEARLSDARRALREGAVKLAGFEPPTTHLLDRGANVGFAGYKQDVERISALSGLFPVVFFMVAALISMTTMTRMVEEERGQIGSVKALGYGNADAFAKYFVYAALATLIGSGLGVVIGFQFFPRVIFDAYSMIYHLPPLVTAIYPGTALLAVAFSLIATLGGVAIAAVPAMRATPAALLRPPAPKPGKRILLQRLPLIWRRLSFNSKVTARNVFRYKKRMWMTLTGIAGCTALVLTGFGLRDSTRSVTSLEFDQLHHYDLELMLTAESADDQAETERFAAETLRADPDVQAFGLMYQQAVSAFAPDADRSRPAAELTYTDHTDLRIIDGGEGVRQFLTFRTERRRDPVELTDAGVLVTAKLAERLNIGPGDAIRIEPSVSVYDSLYQKPAARLIDRPVTVPVTGVIEHYVMHDIYMTPALYRTLSERPLYSNACLLKRSERVAGAASRTSLSARLLADDHVGAIRSAESVRSAQDQRMARIGIVMAIIILSAGALAGVVLFNLSSININERQRELATLKVLGFNHREVDSYVFRETVILTLIGTAVGLAAGVLFHRYLIGTVEVDMVRLSRAIRWQSFLWSALMTNGFALLVNLAMMPRLRRIDMVTSLKSVE